VTTKVNGDEGLKDDVKKLAEELAKVSKEITPNGKNTTRLGDTAARTEAKVDMLTDIIKNYTQKVDDVAMKLERHLGFHEGESE